MLYTITPVYVCIYIYIYICCSYALVPTGHMLLFDIIGKRRTGQERSNP